MRLLGAVVLAAAAFVLIALIARPGIISSTPPNLLLITVDTLRADRLGAYGWARAATTGIDGLAARGVLFEDAFTVAPITLPAHATLLTGRLPPRHGIRGNSFYTLPAAQVTLSELLKAGGYRTAAVVGAAVLDSRFGLNSGFDLYDDEMPGTEGGPLIAERDATAVVSRALTWLDQDRGRTPFFLWVHLFDPHHPYAPPEPLRSQFPDAPYDGEIAHVDREIGRLLSALEARKELDDTLVVLTSDHGESLGEHGEATHGVFLYDSTLHIPLIVAGPGVPKGRRIAGDPVSLVDVLPTILGRLNLDPPGTLEGQDLLAERTSRREFVYSETYLPRDFYNWSELQALRSSDTKFIRAPRDELFELTTDPREAHNLAERHPPAIARLTRLLGETVRDPEVAGAATPDAVLAQRLQSLGYVAGAPPGPSIHDAATARPDPKSRVHLVKQLDEALAFARSSQKDLAVPVLRDILSADPTNYLAAHTLGEVLFDLRRDPDAISAYRIAMRGREVAYYHYRLGLLYERQRDAASAADQFGTLVRLSGDAAKEVVERAVALLNRGAATGALAYLDALSSAGANGATLNVSNGDLHRVRADVLNAVGIARGEAGDLGGATAAFVEAAELAPDNFEAQANLGFTELRRGDADRALEPLERALALRPGETRLLNVIAQLRYRRNELERARDLLTRSLASDPNQPTIEQALREVERRLVGR